jgi:hypothetical protein
VDDRLASGSCFDYYLVTLDYHKAKAAQLVVDQFFLESVSARYLKLLPVLGTLEFREQACLVVD